MERRLLLSSASGTRLDASTRHPFKYQQWPRSQHESQCALQSNGLQYTLQSNSRCLTKADAKAWSLTSLVFLRSHGHIQTTRVGECRTSLEPSWLLQLPFEYLQPMNELIRAITVKYWNAMELPCANIAYCTRLNSLG